MSKISDPQKYREHPKTSVKYWEGAVFRHLRKEDGEMKAGKFYCAKIAHEGKRQTFNLKIADRSAAARKAKDIYLSLVANDWDETLATFKPTKKKPEATNSISTAGEFIEAALKVISVGERTSADYTRAYRFIVGGINGIHVSDLKSREAWQDRIDKTPLSEVTAPKVLKWKKEYLQKHGGDAAALRKAKNTVNSILRKAKALYAKKTRPFLNLPEDHSSPFEGVPFEPRQSMRYRSKIDLPSLVRLAQSGDKQKDIKPLDPETLKIFLLAGMTGLRRNEIDKLEWTAFLWEEGLIRLETTSTFTGKSEESISDIAIDPEVNNFFLKASKKSTSKYVISSNNRAKIGTNHAHYRCAKLFKKFVGWLRIAGVDSQKPIHTLRKEFGSLVCEKHGIYAASRALRHGDIHITTQHYVDSKQKILPQLGGLLSQE